MKTQQSSMFNLRQLMMHGKGKITFGLVVRTYIMNNGFCINFKIKTKAHILEQQSPWKQSIII